MNRRTIALAPSMMRHVLFDLDGTLTDSAPGITRCIVHGVDVAGGSVPDLETLWPMIGSPLREIFGALLPGAAPGRIDVAVAAYVERFDQVGIRENSVFPGVVDALRALREAGCELYVATAKGQEVARRVVHQFDLGPWFRAVFGAHHGTGISSKTEVLRHALSAGEIPLGTAVMVGDRNHDVDAARALGVHAIGVSWGYGTADELAAAHAVAHTPDRLPALIASARLP
jgi:phosphoglycolate phosphatase